MDEVKPFDIPKREVWEAFKKVKANQGAAGVDGQSIADFEADLTNKGARDWFDRLRRTNPTLFAHWQLCHGFPGDSSSQNPSMGHP